LTLFFWSFHTKKMDVFLINNQDRNQTDSRRFEPNSRIFLINEQFNLLYLMQHREKMSRHRGHKQKRRFDRLITIILLSLRYLLFDNQTIKHVKCLDQ